MILKKIKIARVVTVPIVYTHILDLLDTIYLRPEFELHLICSEGEYLSNMKTRYPLAKFHIVHIPRKIEPFKDLFALYSLRRIFIKYRFDIIHSHTPKAGLLSSVAGILAFIPIRLHTFTGQVWVSSHGITRFFFKIIDKVISSLNTHNYADSYGQKTFLLREGVVTPTNISVIHKGSLGGINIERFDPCKLSKEIKDLRNKYFPHFEGKVLLYLGRINRDKGMRELQQAFFELKKKYSVKLLLVGPIESSDAQFENVIEELRNDPDVVFVKFTSTPELYLGVCDIFCFPSYREGFGTVALEASAMQKPVIASDIYGLSDAVADGVSGLLCKVGDSNDLRDKIELLLLDVEFSKILGLKGRLRVIEDFSDKVLTKIMVGNYMKMVDSYRN